jgi:hypothetical protein
MPFTSHQMFSASSCGKFRIDILVDTRIIRVCTLLKLMTKSSKNCRVAPPAFTSHRMMSYVAYFSSPRQSTQRPTARRLRRRSPHYHQHSLNLSEASDLLGTIKQSISSSQYLAGSITCTQSSLPMLRQHFAAAVGGILLSRSERFCRAATVLRQKQFRNHRFGYSQRWTTNPSGSYWKTCCGRSTIRAATLTQHSLRYQIQAFDAVMLAVVYSLLSDGHETSLSSRSRGCRFP